MTRLDPLSQSSMSPEQAKAHDRTAARYGRVGGANIAYLHIPEFMAHNQASSDYFRDCSLSPQQRLFICLVVAKHWRADFFWCVNVRNGLKEGLRPEVVSALRSGRREDLNDDQRLIFELAISLLELKQLDEETYAQAVTYFGEPMLVDIVSAIGFYSSTCLTIIGFDIEPPPDTQIHSLKIPENPGGQT